MTEYLIPSTLEEALALLQAHAGAAQVIAGGTDLMADMRKGKAQPRCLVDITRIPGLDGVETGGGWVQVGAATPFATLKAHPFIARHVHVLAEAAGSVGAPGLQTTATWGGNLVQAMPAADGAIAAVALRAEARVVDHSGAAWRPVEALCLGPGRSAIDPTQQIVTHIRFPMPAGAWGSGWGRIGRRQSLVLPILNCAACVTLRDGRIEQAAIALGPAAPHPLRARQAEAFLAGQTPDDAVLCEAGRLVREEANPRTSVMRASREYRLAVIPALAGQALRAAVRRADGSP
ncbi:MAG: FAD binding domain-containing protein [Anaerolineae bacterium]|nr:FAD binding domain-containing protein [Anaerolineae bacterium]